MPLKQQIILCVDDDPDDHLLVCERIKELEPSLQVEGAHNGVEALDYLHKAKINGKLPCVIILDINMPLMDGKQTAVRIKNDDKLLSIPVVMLSTSSSLIDKTFCDKHGIAFFTKPSNIDDLTSLVGQILTYCGNE